MMMTSATSASPPARILMTRAQDDCARWANILHPLSARLTYVDPFITTPMPFDDETRSTLIAACSDDATAWVITSPRAVIALAECEGEVFAKLRQRAFYAVGEGSAKKLQDAGFCRVQAADGDLAALASLIALTAPAQKFTRIIHLAGSVTVAKMGDALAATPLHVETYVVYAADLAPIDAHLRADLISGEIGAVVLLSARVAEHIARTIKADMKLPPRLYCLSSRIADAARAAFAPHAPEIIIAPRPDIAALLQMIDVPATGLHNITASADSTR